MHRIDLQSCAHIWLPYINNSLRKLLIAFSKCSSKRNKKSGGLVKQFLQV